MITAKIDREVFDLIQQLRQMQEETEAVAARQLDLREQLKAAELKALELHQKIVEEICDVGGEA